MVNFSFIFVTSTFYGLTHSYAGVLRGCVLGSLWDPAPGSNTFYGGFWMSENIIKHNNKNDYKTKIMNKFFFKLNFYKFVFDSNHT